MNEVSIIRLWLLTAFHANIPIILITNKFYGINKKRKQLNLLLSFLSTPAGVRTLDPLIKSQMLYQLSYKRIRYLKLLLVRLQGFEPWTL